MTLSFSIGDSIRRGQDLQRLGRPFITSRQPKPSKHRNQYLYKARCDHPIPPFGKPLWEAYDRNPRRYFLAYQPNDEDIKHFQEVGMQAFVELERKLLRSPRRALLDQYRNAGEQILNAFVDALINRETKELANIAFAAIDFEGAEHQKGVSEIGVAILEGHQILYPNHASNFMCYSFRVKWRKSRKFMFGNTTCLSSEIVASTMAGIFDGLGQKDPNRKVVLVAHGAYGEILQMEDLGFPVESLPIAGIINTAQLCKVVVACRKTSLEYLLRILSIPARFHLLHCAGNDAHYTLQILLALLRIKSPDFAHQLESLARMESPLPSELRSPNEASEDWADVIESAGSFLYE